ncbi:hypothetical protein, partial [Lentimicrobium sp. S6]|uniref:hypothetical protein n=1 Tax=Lentimicrobium sp. S6 TaxID=2735872 RepID=UPI001553AAD0
MQMLAKPKYGTPARWPEKAAGELRPNGGIALIFLDLLVLLFAYQLILFELMCRFSRQHQGKRTQELPIASEKAELIIKSIDGKQVAQFNLTGETGQKVWDTRSLKAGAYNYEFISGEL